MNLLLLLFSIFVAIFDLTPAFSNAANQDSKINGQIPLIMEKLFGSNLPRDTKLRNLQTFDTEKRTPIGFQGMRGKKEFNVYKENKNINEKSGDLVNIIASNRDLDEALQQLLLYPIENKRERLGFFGMRGKKHSDIRNDLNNFIKDLEYTDQLKENLELLYKFYPNLFLKVFAGLREQLLISLQDESDMRNKRLTGKENNYFDKDLSEKRAPTGFLGVRGKKQLEEVIKREPNGFYGVRGKKDDTLQTIFKRSVLSDYYRPGIKPRFLGKDLTYFGNRGKKEPSNLLGKFVGVRGKKNYENPFSFKSENLRILKNDFIFDKRDPTGFIGMRGKRLLENNDEDVIQISST